MTLIAHFNSFGVPTLLGDLLLSAEVEPAAEVHVPASRNINERIFLRPNFYIVGLIQKVVILNSQLAIAWSGSYCRAVNFFSSLESLRNMHSIDGSYVNAMLDAIDEPIKQELSWIALVATGSDCALLTNRVEPLRDYGPITHVTFGGSGAGQFGHIFPQLCHNILTANPNASVEDMREGFAATVLGSLAGEEFDRPLPLQEGWGGGFEILRLIDGCMRKLKRQLSINFVAEPRGGGWDLWFVPHLRYTDYWNELAIVQAIEHEIDASGKLLPGRRDVFVVSPPGGAKPDLSALSALVPIDPQAHDLVQTSIVLQGRDRALSYAARYPDPALRYEAALGANIVRIDLNPMLVDAVIEGVRRDVQQPVDYRGMRNRGA